MSAELCVGFELVDLFLTEIALPSMMETRAQTSDFLQIGRLLVKSLEEQL